MSPPTAPVFDPDSCPLLRSAAASTMSMVMTILGEDRGDDEIDQTLIRVGRPAPVEPAERERYGQYLQIEQRSSEGEDEPDDQSGQPGQGHDEGRRQPGQTAAAGGDGGREGEVGQVTEALPESLVTSEGHVHQETATGIDQGQNTGGYRDRDSRPRWP